jgi:adenine phosphoribosyltransferase
MNSNTIKPSDFIRDVPDFPSPGILFKDITPLLANPKAFQSTIDQLSAKARELGATAIAGPEARGFLFGAPLALAIDVPFVPIRKKGKLPWKTYSIEYQLEYGSDILEIHKDGLAAEQRVLIVDDVLATGGTVKACWDLVKKVGATPVGCAFVIELSFLNGRAKLAPAEVFSLAIY